MHDFSRSARRSVPADRLCGFIYLDYDAPAPLRGDRRDRGCLREASPTPAEVVPAGSNPVVIDATTAESAPVELSREEDQAEDVPEEEASDPSSDEEAQELPPEEEPSEESQEESSEEEPQALPPEEVLSDE